MLAVLRALLNSAVDEQLLTSNPAARLARSLRITVSKTDQTEAVKALTLEQLERLLASSSSTWRPLWFLVSRTGLRIGEALVLRWSDVDLARQELRVERTVSPAGEVGSAKSGHGRTVDISSSLSAHLVALADDVEPLARRGPSGAWLFPSSSDASRPRTHSTAGKAFRVDLAAAGLPLRFSPHSLRHSFASILLAAGVSPVYVQEQLGHASIELTVGTYGRWLRKRSPGALDTFDPQPEGARP